MNCHLLLRLETWVRLGMRRPGVRHLKGGQRPGKNLGSVPPHNPGRVWNLPADLRVRGQEVRRAPRRKNGLAVEKFLESEGNRKSLCWGGKAQRPQAAGSRDSVGQGRESESAGHFPPPTWRPPHAAFPVLRAGLAWVPPLWPSRDRAQAARRRPPPRSLPRELRRYWPETHSSLVGLRREGRGFSPEAETRVPF